MQQKIMLDNAREYCKALQSKGSRSWADIAASVGITVDTVNNFLYERVQKVEFSVIALLVKELGGSLDELVGIEKQQPMPGIHPSLAAYEQEIGRLRQRLDDRKNTHERDMQKLVDAQMQATNHLHDRIRFQTILIYGFAGMVAALVFVLVWFLWDALHSDWGRFQLREIAQLLPVSILRLFKRG